MSVELTVELLVDHIRPDQPAISPDGRWVAYVTTPAGQLEERPLSVLWLAAADGNAPARQLSGGTAVEASPRWAADSITLFFLSDRTGSVQVHRMRTDGGGAETLTSWRGEISDLQPLADEDQLAVVATAEPDEAAERQRAERDDATHWDDRLPRHRLWWLDLASGELTAADGLPGRHVVAVTPRPDGAALAMISWSSADIDPGLADSELHVIDLPAGAVHDLGGIEQEAQAPVWWRGGDGWHLAYLATQSRNGGFAVFDIHPLSGDEHRNLTGDLDRCPAGLAQVADGPPLALFADRLDTVISRLDPATARFRQLSAVNGLAGALTASGSGERIAVVATSAHEPADIYAGPPARLRRITETSPELRRIWWGVQERLSYPASDGLDLDGLLILPPGRSRADGPFPLLTLLHGGPYGRWADQLMIDPHAPGQWLAATGYAVFLPNPRGSQGRGRDFAATVTDALGGGEWTDITDGIDRLIADGVADPGRLGISGWSHGGYLANWAVTQTDRFSAALTGAGVSDWGMIVATGEAGRLEAELGMSCGWEGPGPHPHDQISPVSYASKVRTPVLILHGENDTNVPLSQALFWHRALREFGVEHEFVIYPREGHGMVERSHRLDVIRRTQAWFDRWLRD